MNGRLSYRSRLVMATALLSVALLAYQVAIMQLLSLVQWYHFASMVISVALLGFGAAGTALSLMQKWLLQYSNTILPVLMIICGLTMTGSAVLSHSGFARFDSYLLFVDRSQWTALLFNYILFFLPFFFGALALGIIFVKYVWDIGKFYFSNLAGSGVGAVIAAALSWYFWPATLPVVIALIAIAAGFLVMRSTNRWHIIIPGLVVTAFTAYYIMYPVRPVMSEYKSLSRTMNLPASRIIIQQPSPYGFVQVASADALRYAPGLSLAFSGEVPVKATVFNNGDWFGPLVSWNPGDIFHLLDYTTMALPYAIKKRNKVLVLHAGTGLDVSHALSQGALQINVVESHKAIANLLLHELADDNDSLFYHPAVKMHVTEPRTFLAATQKKYDLIALPLVGTFGGGSGLSAMREEYSLTKEAFLQMWDLLEPDGVISISAWMDYPLRNPLKTVATLAETAEEAGITSLSLHLAAVRSWGTVSFLLKKSPFTSADTSQVRLFCANNFFDPLLLPGLKAGERSVYNGMSDSSFFAYIDEAVSGSRDLLYKEYDFHLRPATDDKPYFSQFLRWESLPHLSGIFGTQSVPFLELGWQVSAITFLQLSLLAFLLIILPLFKIGLRSRYKGWTFLYFSGLGIGYMLFEIVLIQRFILFFGNPVYAAALVIGIMLFASGAGSYYSSKFEVNRSFMQRILLFVVLLLLVYTYFLSPLLQACTGFPMEIKLLISLITIACPAFLMGMPFPSGLRALSKKAEKNIPWAWGINSCMSVISAAFASLLAVEVGFTTVMVLAVLAYAMSMLSVYLINE